MSTHKIAVVVGSLRKDSLNKKLAHALEKAKPADMVKGESKMASKAPSESEIAGAAPTTDVKEIGALEEAEEEPASSGSPTN